MTDDLDLLSAVPWAGTAGAPPPTPRLEEARRRVRFGALLFFDDGDAVADVPS